MGVKIGPVGFGLSPVPINQTIDPIWALEGFNRHGFPANFKTFDHIAISGTNQWRIDLIKCQGSLYQGLFQVLEIFSYDDAL
jgi:hypothetical protein